MNLVRCAPRDIPWVLAVAALFIVYAILAVSANLDLSGGRFALFMDERITFDGVQRILHSESVAAFKQSVMDGGDHRYGRSLWNSMAAASLLPAYYFGDTGQIVASRMLQVLLLMAAFLMLAQTCVRSRLLKVILLAVLLALPYTDYYMTMPKPEPLQLFFLAAFLYFYKKNDFALGKYWIFLGLAFGTKVSTLPLLIVFATMAFIAHKFPRTEASRHARVAEASASFSLGFGLAVPILLLPILAAILAFLLIRWFGSYLKLEKNIKFLATGIAVAFLIASARPQMKIWESAILLNTKHGADQESVNFISWVNYFYDTWLVAPTWLGWMLTVSAVAFLVYQFLRSRMTKDLWLSMGLVLVLAGLALNLSIFVSAHRLWGHYLFPGTALALVGLFSLIDASIARTTREGSTKAIGAEFFLANGTALILAIVAVVYWAPDGITKFRDLASRTERPEYKMEFKSYVRVVEALTELSQARNKKLVVAFDPRLFLPVSNASYTLVEFWGPYTGWDKEADVIVFSAIHTRQGATCLAGSPVYQACLAEREAYSRYVVDKGVSCVESKCYERYVKLPNGGEMLLLKNPQPRKIR